MKMSKLAMSGYVLTLVLSWLAPVASIVHNRLSPSYESAMGVAYGFAFGCAVHLVMILVWVAIRRSKLQSSEFIPLLLSFMVMVAMTVFGDSGALSKM